MKYYIRSYWTKYKQLYKKGLKGIAAFLAIGAIIFFVLATIASRGMGVIFNEVVGATNDDAWFCNRRGFNCNAVGDIILYRFGVEGP